MKLKLVRIITLMVLFCVVFGKNVNASGFFLKSIGNVDTGGQQLSHWWYSSTVPVFHGEAAPGADIIVDIDGKSEQIAADSSGNWDYTGRDLVSGDHTVSFTSSGSSFKFTLTLGNENVDWKAVESGPTATLPAAGTGTPTILLLIGGLGMGILGGKMVLNAHTE